MARSSFVITPAKHGGYIITGDTGFTYPHDVLFAGNMTETISKLEGWLLQVVERAKAQAEAAKAAKQEEPPKA